MDYQKALQTALLAASRASEVIMEYYNKQNYHTMIKEDDSPVTEADLKANQIIVETLLKAYPDHGILTEEADDNKERLSKDYVWIIDPLDGTKDFIHHTDEFTVNIALIHNHQPVLGVIAIPAWDEVYYAYDNGGSYHLKNGITKKIHVDLKENDLIMLRSRFHFGKKEELYFKEHSCIEKIMEIGSSIKACYIAQGVAHIYPKLGPGTKEWDVAPSAIIIKEAGGLFLKPNGSAFTFNREEVQNLDGFIILNKYNKKLLIK